MASAWKKLSNYAADMAAQNIIYLKSRFGNKLRIANPSLLRHPREILFKGRAQVLRGAILNGISDSPGPGLIIGDRVSIGEYSLIHAHGGRIEIGGETGIGTYCAIFGVDPGVKIGSDVHIAARVTIVPSGLHFEDPSISMQKQGMFGKRIVIEDNVWIGTGCSILGGVTIGTGSIIGAGSVVTRSIPSGVIAYGNPCRVAKYRPGLEPQAES